MAPYLRAHLLQDGARVGGRFHGQDECSTSRLNARAQLQQTPWSGIDPALRREVVLWATGRSVNNVPRAIEFAADRVAQSFIGRNAGSLQVARIHNTFVVKAGSLGWGARVEGQVRAGLSRGLVVAGVVALVGSRVGQRRVVAMLVHDTGVTAAGSVA
ncbi:MAG: hypothetical protein AB8I08_32970 [Sandaracinaceae bacterium]